MFGLTKREKAFKRAVARWHDVYEETMRLRKVDGPAFACKEADTATSTRLS